MICFYHFVFVHVCWFVVFFFSPAGMEMTAEEEENYLQFVLWDSWFFCWSFSNVLSFACFLVEWQQNHKRQILLTHLFKVNVFKLCSSGSYIIKLM